MKKNKIITLLIFISFIFLLGCSKDEVNEKKSIENPEENISAWADPSVENILISMNKEDYESFSKDFSANMKNQLDKELFNEQLIPISELIGDYIKETKELLTTEELEESNIKLIYSTDYSNEEKEVIITIVFNKDNKNVEGLFMNSEKIQKMK